MRWVSVIASVMYSVVVESKLLREVKQHPEKVNHLAIIMDGNRRFAWSKALKTDLGAQNGQFEVRTSS